MAKILLVEDDNNLREIYGERLMAEGYDIVSAADGEEALQTAVTEKPDLIISDVMMPKISGFDMLDILRQTPETKDVKIIMMTALSQAEDKTRADKLGADKYLVKSQVTLEDVARVVHDLLGDDTGVDETTDSTVSTSEPAPDPAVAPTATPQPVVTQPEPVVSPPVTVVPEPVAAPEPPQPEPVAAPEPVSNPVEPVAAPVVTPDPISPTPIADPAVAPTATPQPVVTQPEPVVSPPVTVVPEPVAAPEPPQPEPVAAPEPVSNPVEPVAAQTVNNTAVPPTNPISGDTVNALDAASAQAQTAQAEDSQAELNEVAQQIEQFVAATAPESQHQEPIHEPTQQEIIHAQNAAEEPKIVPAQPVATNVPPVVPVNTSSPEPASARKKIISPINGDGLSTPDIHALYEKELAKEAADSPVTNPGSGQVVNAPEAPNSVDGVQNPISTAPPTPEDVVPPPLETVDATQISGVFASEEEAELAAATGQAAPNQPQPTQQPASPIPEQAPTNPSDPNNIAL
jgi:CheY-like chemotaxis protein